MKKGSCDIGICGKVWQTKIVSLLRLTNCPGLQTMTKVHGVPEHVLGHWCDLGNLKVLVE